MMIIPFMILLLSVKLSESSVPASSFLEAQLKFERVRSAEKEKGELLKALLKREGLNRDSLNVLFVHYKDEQVLELFAKAPSEKTYRSLTTYNVCAASGELGPKNEEGDGQVPEGSYHIAHFNPNSNFHLSLGINYPNESDRKRSKAKKLGGDIYIHGDCVTIGCLPMTDDKIKEIYLLAVYAKSSGQLQIPVYIFPFRMTDEKIQWAEAQYRTQNNLLDFWKALQLKYNEVVLMLK